MQKEPKDIENLAKRIQLAQSRNKKHLPKHKLAMEYNQAFRMATEFIAPVFIGLGLGFLIDRFFSTLPFFLIIWAILGCAAGILNIYKASEVIDKDKQEL